MPDSAAPRYTSRGASHSVIDPAIAPALSMQSKEAQELVTQPLSMQSKEAQELVTQPTPLAGPQEPTA